MPDGESWRGREDNLEMRPIYLALATIKSKRARKATDDMRDMFMLASARYIERAGQADAPMALTFIRNRE